MAINHETLTIIAIILDVLFIGMQIWLLTEIYKLRREFRSVIKNSANLNAKVRKLLSALIKGDIK